MWTPAALRSKARVLGATVWRVVEHQYTSSTRRLVDSQGEQEVLEAILEQSKPPYPPETPADLHYLLKTPFRYGVGYREGSRFREVGDPRGVFYASEHIRTALAEAAHHRQRFFSASPETPLPRNEQRLTAFSVSYRARAGVDLTCPPFDKQRASWTRASDYSATQALAAAARKAELQAIRYESPRDPDGGANVALLTPSVFTVNAPIVQQTWLCYLSTAEASFHQAGDSEQRWAFPLI